MNAKELIEKKLIWKINENIWGKNCPKCSKVIEYKGVRSLESASYSCRKTHLCMSCMQMGKIISNETRKRLSESHVGRNHTPEQKRKISKSNQGKIRTNEMKIKYSQSKIGTKNPQYGKLPWNIGVEYSDELKKKLSYSHINQIHKPHTEETKKKIRISLLKRLEEQKIPLSIDKKAPAFFDKINKRGYNFQPRRFFDIGYDADGYDEEKHIWIEYDSLYHKNITQQKKDLVRQNNIIKHFESINNPLTEFIRITENKNGDLSCNCVYGKPITYLL